MYFCQRNQFRNYVTTLNYLVLIAYSPKYLLPGINIKHAIRTKNNVLKISHYLVYVCNACISVAPFQKTLEYQPIRGELESVENLDFDYISLQYQRKVR